MGVIRTFCPLGYILPTGTYFDLGVLGHFTHLDIFWYLGILEHFSIENKKNCYNSQRFWIITSFYVCVKIYYLQKELKHFGLEILVIHKILEDIVLNIFKNIFW